MIRRAGMVLLSLALGSCGDDTTPPGNTTYPLVNDSPLPERLTVGDNVRTILVRLDQRAGADRRATQCGWTTLLFDVTASSQVLPTTIDNENNCRLYTQNVEDDYRRQRFVCAGAISVTAGSLVETLGLCPSGMATPTYDSVFRMCPAILADNRVNLSSADEMIMGDTVTDLSGDATLPGPVTIDQPTNFPTATWPATGDLNVEWRSTDATSAAVILEGTAPGSPRIYCTPRINGRVRVSSNMIEQVMFRGQDVRIRVMSFRDNFVMAEGGMRRYRLVGASTNNVILQGRR